MSGATSSTPTRKDYLAVVFRRCVLALAGARVPENTVFERGALELLVDVSEQYLIKLISHLQRIAAMQRRSSPSIGDLALMLHLNELNVLDFEREVELTPQIEETHPVATLNALYFDPNEEELSQESLPFFDRPHQLVEPSRARPAYIPGWMPQLPADHTYMHTESHSSGIRDLREVRVSLVEEGRLAERALQRLLGDKGSASIIELKRPSPEDVSHMVYFDEMEPTPEPPSEPGLEQRDESVPPIEPTPELRMDDTPVPQSESPQPEPMQPEPMQPELMQRDLLQLDSPQPESIRSESVAPGSERAESEAVESERRSESVKPELGDELPTDMMAIRSDFLGGTPGPEFAASEPESFANSELAASVPPSEPPSEPPVEPLKGLEPREGTPDGGAIRTEQALKPPSEHATESSAEIAPGHAPESAPGPERKPLKLQLRLGPAKPAVKTEPAEAEPKKLSLKLAISKPKKKKAGQSFLGKRPHNVDIVQLARQKSGKEESHESDEAAQNGSRDKPEDHSMEVVMEDVKDSQEEPKPVSSFHAALASFVR